MALKVEEIALRKEQGSLEKEKQLYVCGCVGVCVCVCVGWGQRYAFQEIESHDCGGLVNTKPAG